MAFALSAAITALSASMAVAGDGPFGPFSRLIAIVLAANFALIFILAVYLVRRIAGLSTRDGLRTGSAPRLHLRFARWFSLAAIAPAIIVAVLLAVVLLRGLDAWFSARIEGIVVNAVTVADAYIKSEVDITRKEALAMAVDLNQAPARSALDENLISYRRFLTEQIVYRNLAAAYVINGNASVLASAFPVTEDGAAAPGTVTEGAASYVTPSEREWADAVRAGVGFSIDRRDGTIRALVRLDAYPDAFLYIARETLTGVFDYWRAATQSAAEFRAAEESRGRVQLDLAFIYLQTAALIVIGAVWLGLSSANQIADPIGRLAAAAGRVRDGDVSTRVPVSSDNDEVGELGRAFNEMTAQLEAQRADLVTAREMAEQRRRFSEAVLGGVSAGVIGLDPDRRITLVNRSAEALLGQTADALQGRLLLEAAPSFAALFEARKPNRHGAAQDVQVKFSGPNGQKLFTARTSQLGSNAGHVVSFDDVTRLVAAQRSAAWRDVARRIAHEIKNPLTPIQLSAERLARKYRHQIQSEPEVFERCTETIVRQVSDIGRMVDEFSAFARMPAPRLTRVDLRALIEHQVFASRLAHPEADIETDLGEDAVWVDGDDRLLSQALLNLLKNAAEAITRRPEARSADPALICVRLRAEPLDAVVEVSDSGVGWPSADLERWVEPYQTTRDKGTGLGLAIVKRVAEDHHGVLELANRPDDAPGAVVRLRLPLAAAPAAVAAAQ